MQFEKWYPIDLLKPPTHAYDLGMILYTGDGDSVIVGAVVTRDGDPVTLAGTVQGYVILPDGSTPPAVSGTIDGNRVSVTLPETAMVLSGRITLAIRVINGDERTVVLGATAMVRRTSSESAYDPDAVIPTWDQVLVKIRQMDDAAQACNDATQAAQAVVSSSVRYDTAQTLAHAEKAQARENINAQERIDPDGTVALDLSDSAAAYPTGNVGQSIGTNSSAASTTYKRAAWVQRGCAYVISVTNVDSPASTTSRTSMIADESGIILQRFSVETVAGSVVETHFTADADGLLWLCVDVNATAVAVRRDLTQIREIIGAAGVGQLNELTGNVDIGDGGSATRRGITATRTKNTLTISGTATGAIIPRYAHEFVLENWSNNDRYAELGELADIPVLPGRLYRLSVKPLSGQISGVCTVNVYGPGGWKAANVGLSIAAALHIDFVAETSAVIVCGYIGNGVTTGGSPFTVQITLTEMDGNGLSVPITGTTPTITAVENVRYECGTVTELDFTPSTSGLCEVVFTSGSTATVLTLPSTVRMPDWWTGVESNRIYDLMVLNGTLGMVTSWAT